MDKGRYREELRALEERFDKIPADCPLVAISKTETTSCEWCDKIGKYAGFAYATFFEQTAPDEQYEISVECKYCPNCGRRLEGKI